MSDDARYAANMEAILFLWPTRHDSGINRAILRHALRYARAWRRAERPPRPSLNPH